MKKILKTSLISALICSSTNANAFIFETQFWRDVTQIFNTAQEVLDTNSAIAVTGYTPSYGAPFVEPALVAGKHGELRVGSFNIKGFPELMRGISDSQVQQMVNGYINNKSLDVVAVQENWIRNDAFMAALDYDEFPYRSDNYRGTDTKLGDGLTTASRYPFPLQQHITYTACTGTLVDLFFDPANASPDCSSQKGFTFSKIHVNKDLEVHVYNTHMDTHQGATKQSQFNQLRDYIQANSDGYPVIVVGDFNVYVNKGQWANGTSVGGTWAHELGLKWACAEVKAEDSTKANGNPSTTRRCDGVDHLAFRGNGQFTFEVTAEQEVEQNISDHNPLITTLRWTNNSYGGSNVALNQPTNQSGTAHGGLSSYAVDGDKTQVFSSASIGAHTVWQDKPYWEVDLGEVKAVSNVEVFHRTDWGRHLNNNYSVMISTTPMAGRAYSDLMNDQNLYAKYYLGSGGSISSITTENTEGRYIRIQSHSNGNALMLGEVEVYGKRLDVVNAKMTRIFRPDNTRLIQRVDVGKNGKVIAWGYNNSWGDQILTQSNGQWQVTEYPRPIHWDIDAGPGSYSYYLGQSDINRLQNNNLLALQAQVPGTLKQMDVGADGTMWGVTDAEAIFRWTGSYWQQMPGQLTQISVGNSQNVCGVTRHNTVYCYNFATSSWAIDSDPLIRLKYVSVGANGHKVGVGMHDRLWANNGTGWQHNETSGVKFDHVELGRSNPGQAVDIWGRSITGEMYKAGTPVNW